jgi:hypothetical protein
MITQKITLTEKGLNAGPLYDIYYSSDCINYILTGAQTSLPNVGSTANVQVADNTVCVKLINLSPDCTENEVIIDYRVTTTTTAGPTTTTTTTTAAPTTTTTTQDPRFTTTTTYAPGTFARVLAQNCQNSQDSNYFLVPVSPTPALNSVYKDNTGTCYTITGIPTGSGTTVGTLTYVGGAGSCNNAACITTTTTIAPICNTWTVTNPFGAGYYFKYKYCGQSNFLYPEVPANSSVSVCVQNNQIFDAFNTMMTFTSGSQCFATTSTTTIPKVFTRVVAHACQDFYDFGTYGVDKAVTPNPQIDQVFKDAYGTCYYITSIPTASGPIVGELTFVGGVGACSSSACVTTTTTEAPFCNQWKVDNPTGAGYYFKYQYCGNSPFFLYPEVPAYSSVTVCTQNNRIFNSFGAPLSFTNLNSACFATTTTTTTIPPQRIFTAAPCQNIYDFRVYSANAGAEVVLGAVFKDENGTCYEILSFNGQIPVGRLTYVGAPGACTSPLCITTTTTAAPFCNLFKVENLFGAAYTFKYKYCGQTTFTYPEVPPYSSVTVCTQNNEISNPFGTPLVFDNLSGSCLGTTTTTTTIGPKTIFTAYPCQNIADFRVYQADSASYALNDVFKDGDGTCYTLLNFNGQVPVGNLSFVGTSGSCSSPSCVTTTTTISPYCNQWQVTNPFGSAYIFKYKYCGQTGFLYPEVPANSSVIVCVQNDEISNPFGSPLNFDNLTAPCNATTTTTSTSTTTSTTTTTTRAPYCSFWTASNAFGAGYNISYTYCGTTGSTFVEVPANSSIYVCVQSGQISNLGNPITLTESSSSCAATTTTTSTTTTTTLAPGCWIYDVVNGGGGTANLNYVFCGNAFTTSVAIPSGGSGSFCVDNGKISSNYFFMIINRTSTGCVSTTTTTAGPTTTTTAGPTTTTTTLAPTTTTTTAGLQKVVIEDCDTGGVEINVPITLAVNAAPLSNGQIAYIADGFGGYNCFTVTNANFTGTTLYFADLTSRFTTCEECLGGETTTTTTAGPTTTTTTLAPTTTTTTLAVIPISPVTGSGLTLWVDCGSYSGSVWYDKSGNNNNATVSDAQSGSSIGVLFIESTSAIFSSSLNATPSSSFTLVWHGTNTFDRSRKIFNKGSYSSAGGLGDGWILATQPESGVEKINFVDQAGWDIRGDANYDDVATTYTCVIQTNQDGSTSPVIYKNGTGPITMFNSGGGTSSPFNGWNGVSAAANAFNFGGFTPLPPIQQALRGYTGYVTDVLVYNRALTTQEIQTNANYFANKGVCPGIIITTTTTTTTTAAPTTTTTAAPTTTTTNAPQTMYLYDLQGYRSGTSYMSNDGLWYTTGNGVTGPTICSLPTAINSEITLNLYPNSSSPTICGYASWGGNDCRNVLLTAKWGGSRTYYIKYYNCSNILSTLVVTLGQNQTYNIQGVKRGREISFWNSGFANQIISYVWLSDNGIYIP